MKRGHQFLPTPACNPTELVWAHVERKAARRNNAFIISELETLCKEELEKVVHEHWTCCIDIAAKRQEDAYR
jgi:hypothetical protein